MLSRRRRWLLALAALLLTTGLLVNREFALRFRSYWLDPEPRLAPGQAAEIATVFPLPPLVAERGGPAVAKRVHIMYGGYRLDSQLRPNLQSWRRMYPDYELYFWTDKEIAALISRRYPSWQRLYSNQLSNYLERSDVARAFILHYFGGWYSDVDGHCLRSAESVAQLHGLILPLEPYLHAMANFNQRRLVSNAVMYSVPGHPFWMYYISRISQSLVGRPARTSTLDAAFVTGPVPLTAAALLFSQAHGPACPVNPLCPHLAPPLHFMPTYDNTQAMRQKFHFFCLFTFRHPEFLDECQRHRPHDYQNVVNASVSYTYHAFLHLNERVGQAKSDGDVRSWGLRLLTGPDIVRVFW